MYCTLCIRIDIRYFLENYVIFRFFFAESQSEQHKDFDRHKNYQAWKKERHKLLVAGAPNDCKNRHVNVHVSGEFHLHWLQWLHWLYVCGEHGPM